MQLACKFAFRFLVLTAVFSPLFSLRVFSANDKKAEQAEARALLAKSRDLSNIELAGSPAFVLNAKIRYTVGTQSAGGDATIAWMAPNHYRQAYSAPNYSYSEVVQDGHRYLARTDNKMPLLIYELDATLYKAIHASADSKDKIKKVETAQSGDTALTCIQFKPPVSLTECLDSSGDVITAATSLTPGASALNERFEFSDFIEFGTRRFPRKIVFRGGDGHAIEINVEQLAPTNNVPVDTFTIPADATKETWCAKPESGTVVSPEWNMFASLPIINAGALLYCVVGPDGHLRAVTVIHSSKPIKDKDLQTWMKTVRFPRLRCGNDGMEYEVEIGHVN
ncbi:MAG TPA: hypothetical protein VGR84_11090 [Candidatus Acidoferrales bacterium]|nr:hypothetical protein [Candidatus Acidoferrales bacterium]